MNKPTAITLLLAIVLAYSTAHADQPYLAEVIGITDSDSIKVLHNGAAGMQPAVIGNVHGP